MTHTTIRTHQTAGGDFFTVEVEPQVVEDPGDARVITIGLGKENHTGTMRATEVSVDFTVAEIEAIIDHLQQSVAEAQRRGLAPAEPQQTGAFFPGGIWPNKIGGGIGVPMNSGFDEHDQFGVR